MGHRVRTRSGDVVPVGGISTFDLPSICLAAVGLLLHMLAYGMIIISLLLIAILDKPSQVIRLAYPASASSSPHGNHTLFLPMVSKSPSLPGTYACLEWEFGLVWSSDVITLSADGSAIYQYNPPYTAIVTGTWSYTPILQEVGFTGFRWPTATVLSSGGLWARKYLPGPGFDIALSCSRNTS